MTYRRKNPKDSKYQRKYIFVTGGVVSSIGKGLSAASIGALLETRGLRVSMTKMDPYINVDPGTMSPFQHGEVFVTDDGAETDLDLGHYQRFTKAHISRKNSFTTGQVYDRVISKERRGDYLGGTVQVIPHVTDQIKANIIDASQGSDVAIIEIGGTIGDIESLPFLEAIRQFRIEVGKANAIFVHVTLVPFIKAAGELKTKPTQHSVKELRSIGIQPDLLICRVDQPLASDLKRKISLFCNLDENCVFESMDAKSIYEIPAVYHKQGLDQCVVDLLGIWAAQPDLKQWDDVMHRLENPKDTIKVAVVGKYVTLQDSYKSVYEALTHGGFANHVKAVSTPVDSEELTDDNVAEKLAGYDCIVVPGGFGDRGVDGKVSAIRYAREKHIPFLGICYGMQLVCVEFARNVLGIDGATTEETDPKGKDRIIHLMPSQQDVTQKGGSMRLGAWECVIPKGTKAYQSYGTERIHERHRHRYEFNNVYRSRFEEAGLMVSGESPDGRLVEMMEIQDHPWFIAVQFHPELKSRPFEAHPLFKSFIGAAVKPKKTK